MCFDISVVEVLITEENLSDFAEVDTFRVIWQADSGGDLGIWCLYGMLDELATLVRGRRVFVMSHSLGDLFVSVGKVLQGAIECG
jgi:hypothetical protein